MTKTFATKRRGDEGVALLLALLFIVLLTVLVVEFSYESQVEASFTANQGTDFEAYLAAKSAVAKGIGLLAEDLLESQGGGTGTNSNNSNSMFNTNSNNSNSRNQSGSTSRTGFNTNRTSSPKQLSGGPPSGSGTGTGTGTNTGTGTGTGTGTQQDPFAGFMMDSLMDPVPWHYGVPFEPLNDAILRCTIVDEYGKLNLNALLQSSGEGAPTEREWLVETLINFFQYRMPDGETPPEALADAILDWLDYDDEDEERPDGAENEYYEGLDIPYKCKNGPMDSIEELLLIKGMTPLMYYGDPEEEQRPISDYLTVHGDWSGRININTAELELIESMFEANGGDPAAGAEIYETVRTEQPYTDTGQLQGLFPEDAAQEEEVNLQRQRQQQQQQQTGEPVRASNTGSQRFAVSSNVFRIYGDGLYNDTMVRIEAYVYRNGGGPAALSPEANPAAENADPAAAQPPQGGAPPEEPFRVLAWSVIR